MPAGRSGRRIAADEVGESREAAGSHWEIEPCWSTDALRIELDGGELGRLDRIRAVGAWKPAAIPRFRVCFQPWRGALNCGECEKCLRTLVALRLTGHGDLASSFSRPLDLEVLRRRREKRIVELFWQELEDESKRIGDDRVADTIAAFLLRHRVERRRTRMLDPLRMMLRRVRDSMQ